MRYREPYNARHSFVSWNLMIGKNPLWCSKQFGHGVQVTLAPAISGRAALELFGCYHVSQQNTFTGRLTPAMLEEVLGAAAQAAGVDRRARA